MSDQKRSQLWFLVGVISGLLLAGILYGIAYL
jgi:Tfp pilus assembly protein PilN